MRTTILDIKSNLRSFFEKEFHLSNTKIKKAILVGNYSSIDFLFSFIHSSSTRKFSGKTIQIVDKRKLDIVLFNDENLEILKKHKRRGNGHLSRIDIPKEYKNVEDFFIFIIDKIMYAGYKDELYFRFEAETENSFIAEVYEDLVLLQKSDKERGKKELENVRFKFDYLKLAISDNDHESIKLIKKQLEKDVNLSEYREMLSCLKQALNENNFDWALELIDNFLFKENILFIKQNYVAYLMNVQAHVVKNIILFLEDKITIAEKKIFKYNVTYNTLVVSKILELMRVKIKLLERKVDKNPELQKELDELKQQYQEVLNKTMEDDDKIYFLDDKQKKEIKRVFKLAVKLCHPDVVDLEYKADADKIFKRLKFAFDRNDLLTVKQIYETLKAGIFTSGEFTEDAILYTDLYLSLKEKEEKYEEIYNNSTYNMIKDYDDYDEYFKEHLMRISKQIEAFYNELNDLKD